MLLKIYGSLWLVVGLVTAILFVTGTLSLTGIVVIGFFAFGLVFMGMMGVLPATVAHPATVKPAVQQSEATTANVRERTLHGHRSAHA